MRSISSKRGRGKYFIEHIMLMTVSASGDVAARALLWAFGLPFLLMVTVLVLVLWQTHDEGVAAISGLLSLIPYYGLLFLLRHRMRRKMAFVIE